MIRFREVLWLVGLAILSNASYAQLPTDLPALPEPIPQILAPALMPMPSAVMDQPAACVPGHCSHRGLIRRRQCKRHLQEAFLGFPEEFERPELGSMMHAINRVQVGNASAASLTLYQYDFEPGSGRLNLRGRDKLATIAAKLPTSFAPVVVERTATPTLDEQRRLTVLEGLTSSSFPIPPERVVVAQPVARGLRGGDAVLIHGYLQTRISQAGPPVGLGFDSPGSSQGSP